MQLTYNCQHCKKKNVLRSSAWTRSELHREHGDTVQDRCSECPNVNKLELTEIRATPSAFLLQISWMVPLIGVVLGVLLTAFIYQSNYFTFRTIGFIIVFFLGIPVAIGQYIGRTEEEKASRFNRSR